MSLANKIYIYFPNQSVLFGSCSASTVACDQIMGYFVFVGVVEKRKTTGNDEANKAELDWEMFQGRWKLLTDAIKLS